jgi:hypothetical protein
LASPCTDNRWQPTFVHDLEIRDGPYYVGGGFIRLRYDPGQEFVPHACELIAQSGVRDQRGYTNCQSYTRIQCGCSRSQSLGNSTCASFLGWRPLYYVTPGMWQLTGAAPGQALPIRFSPDDTGLLVGTVPPLAFVSVEGICTGNYCRVNYTGWTGWVDIRALSQPGQAGVAGLGIPGPGGQPGGSQPGGGIPGNLPGSQPGLLPGTGLPGTGWPGIGVAPEGLPGDGLAGMSGYPGPDGMPGMSGMTGLSGMTGMNGMSGMSGLGQTAAPACQRVTQWQRMANRNAPVQPSGSDLLLTGGAWTNGRPQNGVIDGNGVESAESYDFSNGGTARMQFSVDGGGKYLSVIPSVLKGVGSKRVSTDHSWAGSVAVADGTRLFGTVTVAPGGSYTLGISRDGYGGAPIVSSSGQLPAGPSRFAVEFADNYAGSGSSLTVHEAEACTGGGGSNVLTDDFSRLPSPVTPPQPAPGGSPAGRTCGSNADCPGSICLLGVCAN